MQNMLLHLAGNCRRPALMVNNRRTESRKSWTTIPMLWIGLPPASLLRSHLTAPRRVATGRTRLFVEIHRLKDVMLTPACRTPSSGTETFTVPHPRRSFRNRSSSPSLCQRNTGSNLHHCKRPVSFGNQLDKTQRRTQQCNEHRPSNHWRCTSTDVRNCFLQ